LLSLIPCFLQFIGQLLDIACGITRFFVDAFCQLLLLLGERLKLFGDFRHLIELCFASRLEKFLLSLQQSIQIVCQLLLILRQFLLLLIQLLLSLFGRLSFFRLIGFTIFAKLF
jgi:hypothetical protein